MVDDLVCNALLVDPALIRILSFVILAFTKLSVLNLFYHRTCQGCDIEKDAMVLKAGEQLGSPEIGLLATMGVTLVKV